MPRSEVIQADLERIRSTSDDEFAQRWGAWARSQDRDLGLVRQRWLDDLETALPYAVREETAVAELVAAKDAHRADPNAISRERKDLAAAAVQAIRAEERSTRSGVRLAGDAYVIGA